MMNDGSTLSGAALLHTASKDLEAPTIETTNQEMNPLKLMRINTE